MKNILIVDPLNGGHHTIFVAHVSKALLNMGFNVFSMHQNNSIVKDWLVRHNIKTDAFVSVAQNINTKLFQEITKSNALTPIYQFLKWREISKVMHRLKILEITIDFTIILYIDTLYLPGVWPRIVDFLFPFPWSCLWFRPWHDDESHLSSIRRFFKNPYTILFSSYCKSIGILEHERLDDRQWAGNLGPKLIAFPDFADNELPDKECSFINEIYARAHGRMIISNLGAITKRKAIISLFEAAILSRKANFYFLFAGQLVLDSFTYEERKIVLNYINNPPENCFVFAGRIPEESVFNALVKISSVLTLLYGDFPFSSNILAKAAIFQKLVIGCNSASCIRLRIEEYKLGLLVSDSKPETISNSLQAINEQYFSLQENARFEEYLLVHSEKRIPQSLRCMLNKSGIF